MLKNKTLPLSFYGYYCENCFKIGREMTKHTYICKTLSLHVTIVEVGLRSEGN